MDRERLAEAMSRRWEETGNISFRMDDEEQDDFIALIQAEL